MQHMMATTLQTTNQTLKAIESSFNMRDRDGSNIVIVLIRGRFGRQSRWLHVTPAKAGVQKALQSLDTCLFLPSLYLTKNEKPFRPPIPSTRVSIEFVPQKSHSFGHPPTSHSLSGGATTQSTTTKKEDSENHL